MKSMTHAAIAAASTALALGSANPWVLGVAILGSQLPDLDTTESMTGRILWPIARWIENRFAHRTVTHSFAFTAIIAILGIPLWIYWGWQTWGALVLGTFVGWFSDTFTKQGVAAFWPSQVRLVIPGNPRARLATGSPAEYWILAIAILVTLVTTNLISQGGLVQTFTQAFFQDTGTAARLYHQDAGRHRVYAQVQGTTATGEAIAGEYEVLGADGSSLVVVATDGHRYQVGGASGQIRPTKIKIRIGEPLTLRTEPHRLEEVSLLEWLATLPQDAYLVGNMSVEDPEAVAIAPVLGTYPTVTLAGAVVTLSHASPPYAAAVLGDQWILLGNIFVQERL